MQELIKRCEDVLSHDAELDALIWAEIDGRDVRQERNMLLARSRKPPNDECLLGFIDPGEHSRNFTTAGLHKPPLPSYTGSIDAALLLVPSKVEWSVYRSKEGNFSGECGYYAVNGKTAAGSLAAAALVYWLEETDIAAA